MTEDAPAAGAPPIEQLESLGSLELLGLVDLHWDGKQQPALPDTSGVDVVLLGGDLTHFKGREAAAAWIDGLAAVSRARVLAVCGNCDRPEVEETLRARDLDLDRRARLVGGVCFLGMSGGLPFGGCPYERSEREFSDAADSLLAAAAAAGRGRPTILVSHQPPFGTRCDLARGAHVGSHAIRQLIERLRPDLVLCGHIHEAAATDTIGPSRIVNPGPWFSGGAARLRAGAGGVELVEVRFAGARA